MMPLSVTTQGPAYPPSEVMNEHGDFIVVGRINQSGSGGTVVAPWGSAIVSAASPLPPFGQQEPYDIVQQLSPSDRDTVLHTLPVPLPCNNYPMTFAPEQEVNHPQQPSYPFHQVPIPDLRKADGPTITEPITLGQWLQAEGGVQVELPRDRTQATFRFEFANLIPHSLYTVMSLRERDLDPIDPTRPGPLGVPNVFVTDGTGSSRYTATLPNPFPTGNDPTRNRITNVIVLWMSYQRNYGGAIGQFGLGGDVHAQLKLAEPEFSEYTTN
jgi:hypothetical protein